MPNIKAVLSYVIYALSIIFLSIAFIRAIKANWEMGELAEISMIIAVILLVGFVCTQIAIKLKVFRKE
ncbi:hypothetical protein EP12_14220 [Alteromonas australica]|jgi:hypothetical protein|uniref:Uncharacterized protein n=1 Tax=Alteromonas australica TaxID=589873 RepID=A0A075NY70_9ALTE|nr:hypothetical protein [Alteromonas australica]MAB93641.1 hypothetical protein [Alteromonas sp.]AIF99634.1 hypothetical protein EP13_13580 [Alteromonas australica]AJP44633.1 hypothetical protein EP12_14220 [Alteromonas australica]MAF70251.1 hypothetical protein [Alteromonas sp.]MAO28672.1 hypothetical protein [Alteromonas sp.]|tara:strand:+ start:4801 stop:5004 length:204 start_codon:yes stop_codon:yes gene_type:complete